MKIQLTKDKSSRNRYYLILGSMGCAGEVPNHATHHLQIVNGIDRGNGYQGYMSVKYFLGCTYIPDSAKRIVTQNIKEMGYII